MTDRSETGLPLVPTEYYLLADDRADYPLAMLFMLNFHGVLRRAEFEQAVADALVRHPLLRSHLVRDTAKHFRWVESANPQPFLSWDEIGVPWDFPHGKQIDQTREIGLRIWVRTGGNRTEVLLQINHACCDGLGLIQYVEDLLAAYHYRCTGESVELAPRNPARLAQRGTYGLNFWRRLRRIPQELMGLVGAIEFAAHNPPPIASHRGTDPAELGRDFPAAVSYQFTAEQLARLRTVARNQGATLNDLLIRDLFLTLGAWNAKHDPGLKNRPLRIMVPTSLRLPDDMVMPATNLSSMVNLDRRPSKFRHPLALLKGISLEMRLIKRWKLGLTFVHFTSLAHRLLPDMRWLLPDSRCVATCVLSNLGPVLTESKLPRDDGRIVAGNVRLDRLESAPPIRPLTRASIVIITYGREMSLMMNFDSKAFTREYAQEFLDQFVARIAMNLDEIAEEQPAGSTAHEEVPYSSVG